MDFKYKISDVAKDFGISTKKVIDMVAEITGETKKTGGTVDEQELNRLLEKLTRDNAESSLDAYFASQHEKTEEPKPAAAKPAADKAPAKPAEQPAPKAEEKPAQHVAS